MKLNKFICIIALFLLIFLSMFVNVKIIKAEEKVEENSYVSAEEKTGIRFTIGKDSRPNQLLHAKKVNTTNIVETDYLVVRYYVEKQSPDKSGVGFKIHINELNNIFYKDIQSEKYFYFKSSKGTMEVSSITTSDQYLPRKAQGYNGYLIVPCTGIPSGGIDVNNIWVHLENAASQSTVFYSIGRLRLKTQLDLIEYLKENEALDSSFTEEELFDYQQIVDFGNVNADNLSKYAEVIGAFGEDLVASIEATGSVRAANCIVSQEGSIDINEEIFFTKTDNLALKIDVLKGETLPSLFVNGIRLVVSGYILRNGKYVEKIDSAEGFRGTILYTYLTSLENITSIKLEFNNLDSKYILYNISDVNANLNFKYTNITQTLLYDFTSKSNEELASISSEGINITCNTIENIVGGTLVGSTNGAIIINTGNDSNNCSAIIRIGDEKVSINNADNLLIKVINLSDVIQFTIKAFDEDGDIFKLFNDDSFTINYLDDSNKKGLLNVKNGYIILNNSVPGTLNVPLSKFVISESKGNGLLDSIEKLALEFDNKLSPNKRIIVSKFGVAEEILKSVTELIDFSKADISLIDSDNSDINIYDSTKGKLLYTEGNIKLLVNTLLTGCTLDYNEKAFDINQETSSNEIIYSVNVNEGYLLDDINFSGEGTLEKVSDGKYKLSNVTKEGVVTLVEIVVKYTITYELNGGTGSSNNPDEYTVQTSRITLVSPKRDGYSFGGWFDNPNFEGEYISSIAKGTTGNITLYAKWTAKEGAKTESKGCGSIVAAPLTMLLISCCSTFVLKKKKEIL